MLLFIISKSPTLLLRGVLPAMVVLVLTAACGSTKGHVHGPAASPPASVTPTDSQTARVKKAEGAPAADSGLAAEASDAADEDTVFEEPADIIDEAQSYCDDGDFVAADSALRLAVRAAEAMDENADEGSEQLPSTAYFARIAAVYKQSMPASWPLPEEIAAAAFQDQLMRSIDSAGAGSLDSAALAAIACQKGVEYDVPMVWNQRVQRALSFYVRHRDVTIDKWVTRAPVYLSFMRKMFADSGLPGDLAYLPLIESGFNPLAYSYANASGIWQFIASTGKLYGLKRNFWIDERRDPIRSTEAAVGYLKKLFGDFGDWHLALAAYNCGENGVSRCIARHKTNDFWLLNRLPRQTRNYVPSYLAALTIAKNPKCFGAAFDAAGGFPLDTVRVKDCISLADIAQGLGIRGETLSALNPHLLRWCTPFDTDGVIVYLPAGAKAGWKAFYENLPPEKLVRWYRYEIKRGDDVEGLAERYNVAADALSSINRVSGGTLTAGRHLFIPVSAVPLPANVVYSAPPEAEIKALDMSDYEYAGVSVRYRVRSGDNLGRIARRYHVRVSQLCRWNHVTGKTILRPGRILLVSRPQPIPAAETPPPAVAAARTLPAPQMGGPVPQPADAPAVLQTHLVEIGDTPFSVSRRYDLTIDELARLNGLNMAHPIIKIGQTLIVKVPAAPQAASTPAAAAPAIPAPDSSAPAKVYGAARVHVVEKGENLFRLSLRYSVTVDTLMSLNRITDVLGVRAGDTLLIPPMPRQSASNLSGGVKDTGVIYYKVKDGDTLPRIAAAFGVSVDSLSKENMLAPDTVLVPGKVIKVVTSQGL